MAKRCPARVAPEPAPASSLPRAGAEGADAGDGKYRSENRRGFARGRQEGAKEAEARFGKATEALAVAVEEISRLRESLLSNASQDMLCLVLSIARQVIHVELSVNSGIILRHHRTGPAGGGALGRPIISG